MEAEPKLTYYQRNREKVLAYQSAYHRANHAYNRQYQREYYRNRVQHQIRVEKPVKPDPEPKKEKVKIPKSIKVAKYDILDIKYGDFIVRWD
jgi:hypothetical protein